MSEYYNEKFTYFSADCWNKNRKHTRIHFFVWNKYAVFEKEKSEYYRRNGKIQLCPNIISKEFLKNNRTKYILKKKKLLLWAIIMKKKCSKCELMKYRVMNI